MISSREIEMRHRHHSAALSSFEGEGVMLNIITTHNPKIDLDMNTVRSLLRLVENILKHAISRSDDSTTEELPEINVFEHTNFREVVYDISQIRKEILCYYAESDPWEMEMEMAQRLFEIVSEYSWDVKLVIVLAAFAVNYGDCWLPAQFSRTNVVARSISILKNLPEIWSNGKRSAMKTEIIKAINELIKSILSITETIMEFFELPSGYITENDGSSMSMTLTLIQGAVYWGIRCIMSCSSLFNGLVQLTQEHSMELWNFSLPPRAHKLDRVHKNLRTEIGKCRQEIETKKQNEEYENLVALFQTTQAYNINILKALFCSKDPLPLLDGSSKKRVGVEVLRRKTVMLLISDHEIPQEEIMILEQIYNNNHIGKTERPYEVIWVPVFDPAPPTIWNDSMQQKFDHLQSSMPWYSLYHPSLLGPVIIKYIKEKWHFDKRKPIIVVLDPQGKVTCQNAIHMMWIWGISAFPFTRVREEDLWNTEKWTIEFIIDGIDPSILNWIRENKVICLYGGENIEWIRKFGREMRRVSQEAKVPLEMIYVGKSNPKEQVKKNIHTIMLEKLSHSWQDLTAIWFFWVRLESMWYSKMQQGKTIENDTQMHEITKMLTFDGGNDGWAVIGRRSGEIMAKAHGSKILQALTKFDEWKANIDRLGFVESLDYALKSYSTTEHCSRLVLPGTSGKTHELACTECGRQMEPYILYRCCDN